MNNQDKMMKYYLNEYKSYCVKEEYIKIEYTEDPVLNYLYYWYKCHIILKDNVELDKLWYLDRNGLFNDNKDNYRKINKLCSSKDIHVDTLFSLWMPLKMMLQCTCNDIFPKQANNASPNISKDTIEKIINDKLYKKDKDLYESLKEFARLASLDINVINYPYIKGSKVNFQKRGIRFYDQVPITLKECLSENGAFHCLLNGEEEWEKWIINENLEMLFDTKINENSIKSMEY